MSLTVLEFDRNCISKEEAKKQLETIYDSLCEDGIAGFVIIAWTDDASYNRVTRCRPPYNEFMIPDFVATLLKIEDEQEEIDERGH